MSYQRTLLRRALFVGLLVISAGTICNRALGLGTGWPAGPVPTPLATPPPGPSPSPTATATPTPMPTPVPTPIPPSYVQIITQETPQLQYRDQSMPSGTLPPPTGVGGPYTCIVAMYLNPADPVQFELFRSFEPRFPGIDGAPSWYGPSQPVSSPGVTAQYTSPTTLATILTTFTVYPHPENAYGRETLLFCTLDSHGNTQTLPGGIVTIMVYPISSAKIFNTFVSNPPSPTPSPTASATPNPTISPYPKSSPYPIPYPSPIPGGTPLNPLVDFTGDTARLNVEIENAYPGGTTWVTVTSPTSVQEVPKSRITAPMTDLISQRNVFIEVGTAKNASGGLLFPSLAARTTYTIRVVQFRPPYHPPTFQETLATASFTVAPSSFNINSQIGKLTP
jgi:hypothetical protein